jgi:hypothetical protein
MLRRVVCIIVICLILSLSAIGAITIKQRISHSVSPDYGSLYFTDDLLDNKLNIYTYSFNGIIANLNLTENNLDASKFSLEVCNTEVRNGERWIQVGPGKFRDKILIFNVNLADAFKNGFLGKSKYRLNYMPNGKEKRVISGSSGPEILVNFMNERVNIRENQLLSASADMRSSMNGVKVELKCKCYDDPNNWTLIGKPNYYISSNKEIKNLVWEDVQCNDACELEFFADTKSLVQPSHVGNLTPINSDIKPKLFHVSG